MTALIEMLRFLGAGKLLGINVPYDLMIRVLILFSGGLAGSGYDKGAQMLTALVFFLGFWWCKQQAVEIDPMQTSAGWLNGELKPPK